MPQASVAPSLSSCRRPADGPDALDDGELMGDDLDSLLDGFPVEPVTCLCLVAPSAP